MMDRLVNLVIAVSTLAAAWLDWQQDGRFQPLRFRFSLRYFTMQSNLLCALAALCLCLWPGAAWAWMLKYLGTAAVAVTLLTVLCYLGPTRGYRNLLSGTGFVMHLSTPVLAILSFCLLERRSLAFPTALWGVTPVVVYGAHYVYRVILAPPERAWEDIYSFNQNGRWYVALVVMLGLTVAVCAALALGNG